MPVSELMRIDSATDFATAIGVDSDCADYVIDQVRRVFTFAQSPIERAFLAAFVCAPNCQIELPLENSSVLVEIMDAQPRTDVKQSILRRERLLHAAALLRIDGVEHDEAVDALLAENPELTRSVASYAINAEAAGFRSEWSLWPQAYVAHAQTRVDAMLFKSKARKSWSQVPYKPMARWVAIAINCDGFEYHSNKDSFVNDRLIDRSLLSLGIVPTRFSGPEICEDPMSAAVDLWNVVDFWGTKG